MTAPWAYHVDANGRPLETDTETLLAEVRLDRQEHVDVVAFYTHVKNAHVDQYGRVWTGSQAEGWHTRNIKRRRYPS